jgi:hypothetical protein
MNLKNILLGGVLVGAAIGIAGIAIKKEPLEYAGLTLSAIIGAGKECPPIKRKIEYQDKLNSFYNYFKKHPFNDNY